MRIFDKMCELYGAVCLPGQLAFAAEPKPMRKTTAAKELKRERDAAVRRASDQMAVFRRFYKADGLSGEEINTKLSVLLAPAEGSGST